jgi:hypothetical protein
MTLLAAVRPDDQNLPLFLHVLGAMVLVGAFVLALTTLVAGARGGEPPITRLGFRALLFGALPGYIVMRVSAQWIADEQGYTGDTVPAWIDIGYVVAEPTLLLLLIALLLSGLGLRRARRAEGGAGGGGGGLVKAAAVLIAIALLADLFAVYAMTTKPA